LSGGVPRIINVICDRALLGAYSQESRTINKRLVRKAASEVSGQSVRPRLMKWLIPAITLAAVLLAGSALWMNVGDGDAARVQQAKPLSAKSDSPDEAPPSSGAQTSIAATEEDPQEGPDALPAEPVQPGPADEPQAAVDIPALLNDISNAASYRALLNLWAVSYDPAAGTACAQAEVAGLRCYYQRGTWNTLRQLDRPVVLTLIGEDGINHEAALTSLESETGTLITSTGPVSVPLDTLSDYWFGKFVLMWRPVNGDDTPIGPGSRNANVRWLRQSLATLDPTYKPAPIDADYFDPELERRLIDFQRRHRLEADGLAGQKTQIVINTLLAADGTPRLSGSR